MERAPLTRTCTRCRESKTIRGVWYVVSSKRDAAPSFMCESCYVARPPLAA